MMRSLSSAVAGLRSHQTKMDVIGNNIANVNTSGFKASRTTFSDVYYQNISGGRSATSTGTAGGTNPTQIGYGASVATIDVLNTTAGSGSTDRALDVYIGGDGFLATKDPSGKMMYTRLGNLKFDGEGNLCDGSGQPVQGFPIGADGNPIINSDGTITESELVGIRVDKGILDKLKGISISNSGAIVGSMEGDATVKVATVVPGFINKDTIAIPKDSTYQGDVKLQVGALPAIADFDAKFGVTNVEFGTVALPIEDADHAYTLESKDGVVTLKDTIGGKTYKGTIADGKVVLKDPTTGKTAMTLTMEPTQAVVAAAALDGMDAYKYQVTTSDKGGHIVKLPADVEPQPWPASGKLDTGELNIDVDNTKPLTPFAASIGRAGPGPEINLNIGNIAVAKFRNPNGMEATGSSYFAESLNSGNAMFVRPGLEGTGEIASGYLELSNVDVSKEFTDMITTQRGFQANSRIITVSDSMLEELVNLKR